MACEKKVQIMGCLNNGFTMIKELSFPPRINYGISPSGNPD